MASSAAQRMILNRSRSAANDPNNEESDQSILDEHVGRVFPQTPPVTRSPPGGISVRSRQSRSSKSTGSGGTTKTLAPQLFGQSSYGHQTLPSRPHMAGSHQSSSQFGVSRGSQQPSSQTVFGGKYLDENNTYMESFRFS